MLDTVHFHIENPSVAEANGATKYAEFIEHVTTKARQGETHFSFRNSTRHIPITLVDCIEYDDTGSLLVKKRNLHVPSHSGELVFAANYVKNRIEVNVSVPKHEAGNNVYYMLDNANYVSWEHNAEAVYRMVRFYIDKIVKDLASHHLHLKVDLEDISVERIDLCYNVLCMDYEEVRHRILAASQLMKNRQSDNSVTALYQDETFTISSPLGWYFKVYNKGKEFEKHDYKEIYKHDPKKADFILQHAQRICRYEIGIRRKFLDYLFWNQLYWHKSKTKSLFDDYKLHRHKPLSPGDRGYHQYKYYKKLFDPLTHKAMRFHLGAHNDNDVWYKNEYDSDYGFRWNQTHIGFEKSFDFRLVRRAFNFFTSMLESYNPDFKDVQKEIKNYVSQSPFDKLVIEALAAGDSLDKIRKDYKIHKSTIYRIRKRFATRGVDVDAKSIHSLRYEYKPISLMPYHYFKPVNNLMVCPVYDKSLSKNTAVKSKYSLSETEKQSLFEKYFS